MAVPSLAIDAGIGEPARPPPVTHSWIRRLRTDGYGVTTVGFRIIPVIDLKGGMAVHAVGGRRDQYRPIRSVWQATADPIALASSIREGTGLETLYVADLDAIEGRSNHGAFYRALGPIWLDSGLRDRSDLDPLIDLPTLNFVAGLESVEGPRGLAGLLEAAGANRLIFSIDLDDGRPRIAPRADWPKIDPLSMVDRAIDLGVRRLILLDLRRVGTGRGVGTEDLFLEIRDRFPGVEIVAGGGIRGIEDVQALRDGGASGVLIGSALHDGRIGPTELDPFLSSGG